MEWQTALPIITSLIAAIATIVSVLLSNRLQKVNELNLKLRDSLNDKKATFYQELLSLLDDTIDGKYDRDDGDYTEFRQIMQGKFKEAAYYASPEVIKSLGDLMQHYYTNQDENINTLRGRKLQAELTVQIRRDLGHDTTLFRKESWLDILRFSIRDIHDFIPSRRVKDRGRKTRPIMVINGKRIR